MTTQAPTTRRYYIDWLRVVAILMIFIYHSGRFFGLEDWHVKNAHTSFDVEVWSAFLASWGMPFVFLISGASVFYALGKRRPGEFVKDRSLRLLVPLLVGMFTHCALQVYLERISHGEFKGSFWAFLPHYFDGWYGFGGNFAWSGMHLWYLPMLFVFSVLGLPLMWWLRRGSGAALLNWFSAWLARPGAIYLLALPLLPVLILLDPTSVLGWRVWGGWSPTAHFIFFLYGFVLVADEAVSERIQQVRWISLASGLILFFVIFVLLANTSAFDFETSNDPLFLGLLGLHAWCWILALWGFGRRYLNFGMTALWYANEAVLPFYIMHQTVLLSIGYFVVQWTIPDLLKWAVISVASFTTIVALYALLVRRNNVLRVLFGMKPSPRPVPSVTTPPRRTSGSLKRLFAFRR